MGVDEHGIGRPAVPVVALGAVERPGVVQLGGPKTLWEAISEAGGLKHEVGQTIRVTRRRDQDTGARPGRLVRGGGAGA